MVPKRPVTTRLCAGVVQAVQRVLCARLFRAGDRRGCGDVLEQWKLVFVPVDSGTEFASRAPDAWVC